MTSVVLGLLVAASLVPSDTGAAVRAGDGRVRDGGTLLIGIGTFEVIDPALAPAFTGLARAGEVLASWGLQYATCALLLRYPVSPPPVVRYDLVPEVAAALPAVSHDRKTYTFTIRKGFRFSTGVSVTAANYANAINRVLKPAMASPGAEYLQDVLGADAVRQGAAQTALGVKVVGNRLIIRLTKKAPDFPARMTTPYFCPVQKDLPVASEGVGAPLPGSGPYYVAEFVRGSRVVLRRNPFYRGTRARHLDEIVFQVGDDPVVNTRKVEAGQVDVDLVVPRPTLDELGARYGVNKEQFFSVRSPSMFYVDMNTDQALFRNNPKLRQAVNFAIDRPALLNALGTYTGSVTDDYLPPGLPGYVDAHLYSLRHPDLRKAQALARGHTRSGKAVMYTCDNILFGCVVQAQLIQTELKQIGIDVEIKQFSNAVATAKEGTRGEPFDLMIDRRDPAWVDPYQFVNVMLDGRRTQATGNLNYSYFNSVHYNRLIDQAARLSGSARYDAYGKLAVDIARNAAPLAAINVRNNRFFVSSRVGCVRAGTHSVDLAGLCLK
jgi:peptide/nickel transport system substrate-binding protein